MEKLQKQQMDQVRTLLELDMQILEQRQHLQLMERTRTAHRQRLRITRRKLEHLQQTQLQEHQPSTSAAPSASTSAAPALCDHSHQPLPWPTRLKTLESIRKPKFLQALRQVTGKANVADECKELQTKANAVMWKIIASYQTAQVPSTVPLPWSDVPAAVRVLGVNLLETTVGICIHIAEDHWMANYLLNEQCVDTKWLQEPSDSVQAELSFAVEFEAAMGQKSDKGKAPREPSATSSGSSSGTAFHTVASSPGGPIYIPSSPDIPASPSSPGYESPFVLDESALTPAPPKSTPASPIRLWKGKEVTQEPEDSSQEYFTAPEPDDSSLDYVTPPEYPLKVPEVAASSHASIQVGQTSAPVLQADSRQGRRTTYAGASSSSSMPVKRKPEDDKEVESSEHINKRQR